jgi:hypothetical protein
VVVVDRPVCIDENGWISKKRESLTDARNTCNSAADRNAEREGMYSGLYTWDF